MLDPNNTVVPSEAYNGSRDTCGELGVCRPTPLNATNNTFRIDYTTCLDPADTEDFLSSPLFHACVYIMYTAVFAVALLGNGLVCFVVQTSPRMKTVTNYFIVNLAVGDILMTMFCVPFSFVSQLILRYWPFGELMCKVVNYSQAVSVLVSAYTLLAISIDRYMAIMRPLRPRLGKAAAKLVVAAVWGGALATAAPIPIVSQLDRPTAWFHACNVDFCQEKWSRAEEMARYTCALLALQFALPLGALVCTYARIAHAVCGGRPPGEAQRARDTRMQRSKRKMIKMMVTVVAVFTICWLPLNVLIVAFTTQEADPEWSAWPGLPYVWFASHWLAMSHSCYNPIIYCYMNARYRRGFKQALCSLLCVKTASGPRSCRRSSLCDGVPLSELVGANGTSRRPTCNGVCSCRRGLGAGGGGGGGAAGEGGECAARLQRGSTCTSRASSLRAQHHVTAPAQHHVAAPAQALSIRQHFR